MPNRPATKSKKLNREARRLLNIEFTKAIQIENRYEPARARGKEYSDATHARENARRLRHMEAHTHGC